MSELSILPQSNCSVLKEIQTAAVCRYSYIKHKNFWFKLKNAVMSAGGNDILLGTAADAADFFLGFSVWYTGCGNSFFCNLKIMLVIIFPNCIKHPFQNLLIPEFPEYEAHQHTPAAPVTARWKPADCAGDKHLERDWNFQFIPRRYIDKRKQKIEKKIRSVNHKLIAAWKRNTDCRRAHIVAHDFNRQPSSGWNIAERKNWQHSKDKNPCGIFFLHFLCEYSPPQERMPLSGQSAEKSQHRSERLFINECNRRMVTDHTRNRKIFQCVSAQKAVTAIISGFYLFQFITLLKSIGSYNTLFYIFNNYN